jgi:hypothetical protein
MIKAQPSMALPASLNPEYSVVEESMLRWRRRGPTTLESARLRVTRIDYDLHMSFRQNKSDLVAIDANHAHIV